MRFAQNTLFAMALVSLPGQPALAQDLPSEVTLFKNVNVFDGTSDTLLEGHDVLVVRNMIEKVAKDIPSSGTYTLDAKTGGLRKLETPPSLDYHASNVVMVYEEEKTVKKEVNVIDGGGRTLMPGMIEAHGHVTYSSPLADMLLSHDPREQAIRSARRAHDYLMAGFTTVGDMGGNSFGVQKALDAGMFPGPRIYSSGPSILQTTGHGDFRTANDGHPYFDGRERACVADRLGFTRIADGVDEVRSSSSGVRMSSSALMPSRTSARSSPIAIGSSHPSNRCNRSPATMARSSGCRPGRIPIRMATSA